MCVRVCACVRVCVMLIIAHCSKTALLFATGLAHVASKRTGVFVKMAFNPCFRSLLLFLVTINIDLLIHERRGSVVVSTSAWHATDRSPDQACYIRCVTTWFSALSLLLI